MTGSRSSERLRQERETFEAIKVQDRLWFQLRLCMAYVCIALLFGIAVVSSSIVLSPETHAPNVVLMAAAALLIDVLGLTVWIAKMAFSPNASSRLRPLTRERSR
jgi:hypothetical protein